MRHAGPRAIAALRDLRRTLAALPGLVERKAGLFTHGGRAFLHFHEDPAGLFADVRVGDDFERRRVSTVRERAALVRRVRELLSGGAARPSRRNAGPARATRS